MNKGQRILSVRQGEVSPSVLLMCAELYCQIWQEEPWNETHWKPEEVQQDILRDSQKQAGDCFISIIENGNTLEVTGFTWGYMTSPGYLLEISGSEYFLSPAQPLGNVFYVDELGVNKNFRGHHIGKHLSDRLIKNAKHKGANSLVLRTDEKAHAARALYAKLGFTELPVRDVNYPGRTYWQLQV